MNWLLIFALFFLAACQPASLSDLRVEAAAEMRKAATLLHRVDTRDQLGEVLPELQRTFTRLAKLALKARELDDAPFEESPTPSSDALFAELARLYEMPGCRALIESAQSEAKALLRR